MWHLSKNQLLLRKGIYTCTLEQCSSVYKYYNYAFTVLVRRFDVPDRVSAFESLRELNPERAWNLVMVRPLLLCCSVCMTFLSFIGEWNIGRSQ